jgi:hypothetical protein
MLEPAHFLPLPERDLAGNRQKQRSPRVDDKVEEVQADAGDENGSHRDQLTSLPVASSRVRMRTRSFRQKSFSTRASAIGLTFHVSPRMWVTRSTWQSWEAWKRWYIAAVRRSVTKHPSR